jgi:hypothetical protein
MTDSGTRILVLSMIMALTTYFIHAFLNNFLDADKAAVPVFGMCAMIIALGLQQNKLASDPQ